MGDERSAASPPPAAPGAASRAEILHYRRGRDGARREQRQLVGERPLVIELVGGDSFTIMRTPGADLDLAVGFLLAEGIIDGLADVASLVADCELGNTVRVTLASSEAEAEGADDVAGPADGAADGSAPARGARRNLAVASSCGLCGRAGVDKLIASLEPVGEGVTLSLDVLFEVPEALRRAQALFARTGGSHAAALFDGDGELVVVGEDLGRHSALDKAIGRALRDGVRLDQLGAIISGRTSLEMMVKVARAGVAMLVAVSAPSAAAVDCAERLGVTLCGFARGDELTVYAHPQRVRG